MESEQVLKELADELWQAEHTGVPVEPLTKRHPALGIEDAYAIQSLNIDRHVAGGARVCGRKVGLTSRPMQELLGVDEPDYGVLLDHMVVEDGDEIAMGRLLQPRIEAELALVMEHDLAGPGITAARALTAVAGAVPAVEIVDSRVADWQIKLVDTVADNASSGLLVVGGNLRKVTDIDLRLVGVAVTRHGELVDTGAGAAVLGNPVRCVAWLANKLASFGASLHAGDVILPGAVHRMIPVAPGDVFRAEFAHLGTVTARFARPDGHGMMEAKEIASRLIAAEAARTEIPQFTELDPGIDVGTAYAAQWEFVQSKLDAGQQLAGAKLGLTSRNKQEAMGLAEPLYGWVTSGMITSYGEPVDRAALIHPRAEPEIAFLLGRDVTAPATVTSALAATEAVFAAVDILDSRYRDFRFALPDVVADNASAGRVVLGPQPRRPAELVDLRLVGCVFRAGGEVTATAAGAATMGHPAAAVAWLANRLGARGQSLRAGWLILSGGLTAPVPFEPGTAVTAEFDGLGSLEVYCR